MRVVLRGARVVDADGERADESLTLSDSKIESVGTTLPDGTAANLDLTGLTITPGFIDVHTHGGGGYDLHTTDPEEIGRYARWAPSGGTTAFLIGVVGVPDGMPETQLSTAASATSAGGSGAEPLGIHLEGPYINVLRRGAHDPSWLRTPNPEETRRVLELSQGNLRLVTLAPELPGAHEMIATLLEHGVVVSIGHTDADYDQAREAVALGVTHATHCFNAMRPLLHRDPGALGAIVESDSVRGELIADGVHVHPAAMRALVRALTPERTVVVTDALSAAGRTEGEFTFAGQPARIEGGVARLADGSITGSVLTMDQALRNLVAMTGVGLPDAVRMLALNPARSIGADGRKGAVQAGFDADLLIFDSTLALLAAICRGRPAWVRPDQRDRFTPLLQAAGTD